MSLLYSNGVRSMLRGDHYTHVKVNRIKYIITHIDVQLYECNMYNKHWIVSDLFLFWLDSCAY